MLQYVEPETFLFAPCLRDTIYQIPNGRHGQLSRGFTSTWCELSEAQLIQLMLDIEWYYARICRRV